MNEPDELKAAVDRLTDEAAVFRAQLRRTNRTQWVAIAALVIVLAVVIGAAAQIISNFRGQIEANNARFCPLLRIFVPGPGEPEPSTSNGQRITAAISRLEHDPNFRCR
jgi:hypothetical protein